jgi:phosphoribosylglycinamide formyltransferase-1
MHIFSIAVFASGAGSNFIRLYDYFSKIDEIDISFVLCNNPEAYVLNECAQRGQRSIVISNDDVANENFLTDLCISESIDCIILAGFLRKIPDNLIRAFTNRIVNIHPSILPDFGGKGMYGNRVHQAVFEAGVQETGITIHFVNEGFDEGAKIAQFYVSIDAIDTPETIKNKVQHLEHTYYPMVCAEIIKGLDV